MRVRRRSWAQCSYAIGNLQTFNGDVLYQHRTFSGHLQLMRAGNIFTSRQLFSCLILPPSTYLLVFGQGAAPMVGSVLWMWKLGDEAGSPSQRIEKTLTSKLYYNQKTQTDEKSSTIFCRKDNLKFFIVAWADLWPWMQMHQGWLLWMKRHQV